MLLSGMLNQSIKEGIKLSKETLQPILISGVKKLPGLSNPFTFFSAARRSFLGQRFFWSDPNRNFYIVGIGYTSAIDIAKQQPERFKYVNNQWNQLLNQRIINSEGSPLVYGTGPIMFGGLSFDPLQVETGVWKNFSAGKMVVPTFMLTVANGEAWLTTNIIVNQYDYHQEKIAWLQEQENLLLTSQTASSSNQTNKLYQVELSPEHWMNSVARVAQNIRDCLVDKVVLARELQIKAEAVIQVEAVLARLLAEQPSSYIFAIESEEDCFVGAPPERLLKKMGKDLFSMCLAGTIARGKSKEEDARLGNELLNDQKNLHEHAVVVNMVKNAMQEGCLEVIVPEKPTLYKVRDVQHLYMPVMGKIKENVTLLDMVQKLHPTPALGGYPRDKALQKIRQEENMERGLYGAPIGWVDVNGDGEFAVAIRSGLIKEKSAYLYAGCGIVGDSDPEEEYLETQMKLKPMLSALRG